MAIDELYGKKHREPPTTQTARGRPTGKSNIDVQVNILYPCKPLAS